jgi:hypothetical protein
LHPPDDGVHLATGVFLKLKLGLNRADFVRQAVEGGAALAVRQLGADAMTGVPEDTDPAHRVMDRPEVTFDLRDQVELVGAEVLREPLQTAEDLRTRGVTLHPFDFSYLFFLRKAPKRQSVTVGTRLDASRPRGARSRGSDSSPYGRSGSWAR